MIRGILDRHFRPPVPWRLSDWFDRHFVLSPGDPNAGRWRSLGYQVGILDAITDPAIEQITVMKSARLGLTKMLTGTAAFFIAEDPCPIMMGQPRNEDAEDFSREEIGPMLRDVPKVRGLVRDDRENSSDNTILSKRFPGGYLRLVGASTPSNWRRRGVRVIMLDEIDAYKMSAGNEGDPIRLARKRTEWFANRKIVCVSTPVTKGISRIESLYYEGDQRRFHVPCPHCEHFDYLTFHRESEAGHWMFWPPGKPAEACFICRACGSQILEGDKFDRISRGRWVAEAPEIKGHASFKIWSAYSMSPGATWGTIAEEFMKANAASPIELQTWWNTTLGEAWQEKGEAPEWERLFDRREAWEPGTVPAGVEWLTCGVDVQADRFVYEVVGWNRRKESWSIEIGELHGTTFDQNNWLAIDALLAREFRGENGQTFVIHRLAIDSGFNTQNCYTWARRHPMRRVIAIKGVNNDRMLLGSATPVDVRMSGQRVQGSYRVWPVGSATAKAEFYGWLTLRPSSAGEAPAGYCHFPQHPDEYFRQITAEQQITVKKKNGFLKREWTLINGRQNHWLDCRVYARAALASMRIEQLAAASLPPPDHVPSPAAASDAPSVAPRAATPETPAPATPRRPGWLSGGRRGRWIK